MKNEAHADRERCREVQVTVLKNLPLKEKEREAATVKSYVADIYPALKEAKDKGYSYEDLAKLLCSTAQEQGLDFTITAGTLRKYMGDAAKRQTSTPRPLTEPTRTKTKSVPDIGAHRNRKAQTQRESLSHLSPERIKSLTKPEAISLSDPCDEFFNL